MPRAASRSGASGFVSSAGLSVSSAAPASFAAAALSIPPRTGVSEAEENHGSRPHAILYWALLWLGRRDEARPHFETCRRLDPSNPLLEGHARLFASPSPLGAART